MVEISVDDCESIRNDGLRDEVVDRRGGRETDQGQFHVAPTTLSEASCELPDRVREIESSRIHVDGSPQTAIPSGQ